ncbi:MAG: replicative DNA helicase [Clostridia bacterium]|nr:replicative DNA helicase [Clostridia bacterium]
MEESTANVRTVPFSLEAEQSVLGAMFLDKDCIPDAIEILKGDDFYIGRNKELFEAMSELYNLSMPIDVVTLKQHLIQQCVFEKIGGMDFIVEVANFVPTTKNLKHYAKIVKDNSVLRTLIKTSEDIAEKCYRGEGELEDIIGVAEQNILNISQDREAKGPVHIRKYIGESVELLSELSDKKSDVTGVSTGFIDIDKRTAGLHGSELILIAARPGMGKTSFALNIAQNVAIKGGVPVAIFSLEMPGIQLANRMLASEAMVSSEKIKKGDLKSDDWDKVGGAVDALSTAEIYIDDSSGITMPEIGARCRRLKAEKGLGLIVIDYIQLMNSKTSDRQQAISEISRSMKILAKDLNVPVIALSQLNRDVEKRDNKEPRLSDIRESGSIEQDADVVMFLSREGYYNPETEEPNKTKCIFAKHRNGEVGSEYLTWLGEFFKFSNWSGDREH